MLQTFLPINSFLTFANFPNQTRHKRAGTDIMLPNNKTPFA